MSPQRPTVIVADEGRLQGRTALGAVRALGKAGYAPLVTVAGRRSIASASKWCAGTVTVSLDDVDAWRESVCRAAERTGAVLVLPASDTAVAALDLPGTKLIDKRYVRDRALAVGLPVPTETEFPDKAALEAESESLTYPVVVKPARREGLQSEEVIRVTDEEDLEPIPSNQPIVVQPFLTGAMKAISVLVLDGRLVASVHQSYHRIWPPRVGVASAAVTVEPDLELEQQVLDLLESHEGIAQVQFLDGHVIDVNPRAYGSMPLAVKAGANFPALWCDWLRGEERPKLPVRGRAGVHYRWTDADVRAVWTQVRHREMGIRAAAAALTPARHTAHSIGELTDPMPMIARLTPGRIVTPHG